MITTEQRTARDTAITRFLESGDWEAFVVELEAVNLIADEGVDDDTEMEILDEINDELAQSADQDRGMDIS